MSVKSKVLALFLCLLLLVNNFGVTAYAENGSDDKTDTVESELEIVTISSIEEFLQFAENCIIDSYSQDKFVQLKKDLDLSGVEFEAIPFFNGIFDGEGHTISNVSLAKDGSHLGLFRYLGEDAVVRNLTVAGAYAPEGSGCYIGGIAGCNAGSIENCCFSGIIEGIDNIGGIAGENTGKIQNCSFDGELVGEHEAGGIAGNNTGEISGCANNGDIDTTAVEGTSRENEFDIASLTEEDFLSVADIGGIAGNSTGTIAGCTNSGSVGYQHIGYNVGGIAGKSSGYITDCSNTGTITGRRDVGGIVGQQTPYAVWDFSESRLEDLQAEMDELDSLVETANTHLNQGSEDTSAEFDTLLTYMETASDELQTILNTTGENLDAVTDSLSEASDAISEEAEEGDLIQFNGTEEDLQNIESVDELQDMITVPEEEDQEELRNELHNVLENTELEEVNTQPMFDALNGAYASAADMVDSMTETGETLAADLDAVMDQISGIFDSFIVTIDGLGTVDTTVENDVSLEMGYEIDTGAVASCVNSGNVQADVDAGGITGTIGFEVSFDMEDELNLSDYAFSEASYLIFAVIRDCESSGEVQARDECAGGVIGSMDYGAVLNCSGLGAVSVDSGDYAGGIAGMAQGTIYMCTARVILSGDAYVGGIAGQAEDLADCLSYSVIEGSEYLGAVAGWADGVLADNIYVDTGLGAVDGISYAGQAEPVEYESVLTEDIYPESFRTITVRFLKEDQVVDVIEIPFGGSVEELPEVPNEGNRYWKWDEFQQDNIYSSMDVTGKYYSPSTTISTGEDVALFLVEGTFYDGQILNATEYSADWSVQEWDEENILGAYTLNVNDYTDELVVHMHVDESGTLYVLQDDGSYAKTTVQEDGGYLVFRVKNGASFVLVREDASEHMYYMIGAAVGVAVIVLTAAVVLVVRHRKKIKSRETASEMGSQHE